MLNYSGQTNHFDAQSSIDPNLWFDYNMCDFFNNEDHLYLLYRKMKFYIYFFENFIKVQNYLLLANSSVCIYLLSP